MEFLNYLIQMCDIAVFYFILDPLNKPPCLEIKHFDLFVQRQPHRPTGSFIHCSEGLISKIGRRKCCIQAFLLVFALELEAFLLPQQIRGDCYLIQLQDGLLVIWPVA